MKYLFFLVLISVNLFAENEWTLIHKDSKIQSSFFVKLGNFKMIDNKVRLWVMESFDNTQKAGSIEYNSLKSIIQVDCESKKLRHMAYSIYTEKMAEGSVIFSKGSSSSKWIKINPNTVNSAYMAIACQEAEMN